MEEYYSHNKEGVDEEVGRDIGEKRQVSGMHVEEMT
jgi:hypothetical protein